MLVSTPFSQNFTIRINYGFSCIDVSLVPREILKTEGDRSGGYRANLDQSIAHGWVVDVCWPPFCCARTSANTGQAKDDNAGIYLAESANFIRTMVCPLTGHCVHQTCLHLNMRRTFWTEGSTHNTGNDKHTGSWCDVTGELETKSPELFRVCEASRVLICRWWGHTRYWRHFDLPKVTFMVI